MRWRIGSNIIRWQILQSMKLTMSRSDVPHNGPRRHNRQHRQNYCDKKQHPQNHPYCNITKWRQHHCRYGMLIPRTDTTQEEEAQGSGSGSEPQSATMQRRASREWEHDDEKSELHVAIASSTTAIVSEIRGQTHRVGYFNECLTDRHTASETSVNSRRTGMFDGQTHSAVDKWMVKAALASATWSFKQHELFT